MPKINIDELVEDIEVTVGGKTYTVKDIPRDLATKMEVLGVKAADAKLVRETAIKVGKPYEEEKGDTEPLIDIMTEVLGADRADIQKLGMRKLLKLVTAVIGSIETELGAKNVPEGAATT